MDRYAQGLQKGLRHGWVGPNREKLTHILRRIACMFVCIYILTSVGLWPIMFCIRDIYSDTVYSSKTFGIFLFVLQLS